MRQKLKSNMLEDTLPIVWIILNFNNCGGVKHGERSKNKIRVNPKLQNVESEQQKVNLHVKNQVIHSLI